MEKKDSLFAGLNPAPAFSFGPGPGPSPRSAAPEQEAAALKQKLDAMERNIVAQLEKKIAEAFKASVPAAPPPPPPSVSAQEVSALKQKIESLEKNIVVQLEKKISEAFKAAVPAAPAPRPQAAARPPEMNAQFLLTRIGELDKRLEELARGPASSSQMKNIEESKISARREIEDLMKVVREQQAYSGMDRQMHDQLEKSWRRVEELEKKLMDFYGSILAGQQKKEEIDGMLSRDLGGRIEALAARLEAHALAMEKKLPAQDAFFSAAADLKKEVMGALGRSREEHLALSREQAAAFRAMLDQLPGTLPAELERSRRDASAQIESFKKEFTGHLAGMRGMLDEFNRAARETLGGAESMEAAAAKNTAETAALLQKNFEKICEVLGREGGQFLSELEKRNKLHLDALNTKYADALSNASVLDFIGAAADATVKRMAILDETLSDLVSRTDQDQLSAALGVSGMLVRKKFETMESLLAGIRRDAAGLERIKKEVDDRLKGSCGEGNK